MMCQAQEASTLSSAGSASEEDEEINIGDVVEFMLPDLVSVGFVESEETVCHGATGCIRPPLLLLSPNIWQVHAFMHFKI